MTEDREIREREGLEGSARILVVDDEQVVRQLLERFLTRRGFAVTLAEDGKHALDLFRSEPFDLVLTDLRMPGLDGLQLLKVIKDTSPRTPVVLISGYGEVETVVEALKNGAENFLAKPLKMDLLQHVVEQSLNLYALRARVLKPLTGVRQETSVEVPSEAGYIGELVYLASQSAVAVGYARFDLDNNLKLALVEALTNAMEHGNHWDTAKQVLMYMVCTSDELVITVVDQGPGFDLSLIGDPTSPDNLLCERGRGVFLMNAIMDEVHYNETGNRVTLIKRRPSSPEA